MIRKIAVILFICVFMVGCGYKKDSATVIRFSTWGSASEMHILKPIIADFEKENPDIRVEMMHIPQDYFKKIHLLFASNLAPDVIFINNLNLPIYSKFLLEMDDEIDKKKFFSQSIDSLSWNGKLYAIPRDVSTLVIYYNKSLFKNRGVKYPNSNWTYGDMVEIAKKLSSKSQWGIGYEPQIYYALPIISLFGGGILDIDGNPIYESKQTIAGINEYKNLAYIRHVAPIPSEVGSKTLAQMFLDGRIAMHISGRWMVPKYRECARFDWDVINFPNYSAACDSSGWAITKTSKNIEASKKFILYLSDRVNIEKMTKSGLFVPARVDVAKSSSFLIGAPEHADVFIKSVENSVTTRTNTIYNKIIDTLNGVYFSD